MRVNLTKNIKGNFSLVSFDFQMTHVPQKFRILKFGQNYITRKKISSNVCDQKDSQFFKNRFFSQYLNPERHNINS